MIVESIMSHSVSALAASVLKTICQIPKRDQRRKRRWVEFQLP